MDYVVTSRQSLVSLYRSEYGDNCIYECPVCLSDNEISLKRVLKDIYGAECNALCLYYANYGPETVGKMLIEEFEGPVMMIGAAEEGEGDETLGIQRKDSLSGFINACYAVGLGSGNPFVPDIKFELFHGELF